MNRKYNRVYLLRRLTIQIIQYRWSDGVCIHLLPQISIGINNRMLLSVGLEWVCGCVNFGIATRSFVESEKNRHASLERESKKWGITKRQQELRYGW